MCFILMLLSRCKGDLMQIIDLMKINIPGGIMGFLAGLIPTFFSPLIKWNIEKKRNKRKNRKEKLDRLLDWLNKSRTNTDPLHYLECILYTTEYNEIKIFFKKNEKNRIKSIIEQVKENDLKIYKDGDKLKFLENTVPLVREFKEIISSALVRQQKKWKII